MPTSLFSSNAAVLEGMMTREEALKRDFSKQPLSPEERQVVIENLGTTLIALGCDPYRLEEMCNTVIAEINRPRRLHYIEALERIETIGRSRKEHGGRTNDDSGWSL